MGRSTRIVVLRHGRGQLTGGCQEIRKWAHRAGDDRRGSPIPGPIPGPTQQRGDLVEVSGGGGPTDEHRQSTRFRVVNIASRVASPADTRGYKK